MTELDRHPKPILDIGDVDLFPGYEWRREMLQESADPLADMLPCGAPAIVVDLMASLNFPHCKFAELPDGRWIHT